MGDERPADKAQQYLPFVRKIATRIAHRLPRSVEVDELVGAGAVGLMEALDRYDPAGGRSFETYAEFRVKGAIYDELRRNDPVSRSARRTQRRVEERQAALTAQLGRPPEVDELARSMKTSVEQAHEDVERADSRVVAFDTDAIESDSPTPEDQVVERERVARVRAALGRLNARQQQVLNLYYVEELNLHEIGSVLGVTESRVCQILGQMRSQLRAEFAHEEPTRG